MKPHETDDLKGSGSPSFPLFGGIEPGRSPWSGYPQAFLVLALCLAARVATTIHYIEDPDSLRFALAMRDYDVTRLQPHFPGYPVFCLAAKILYAVTGRYAIAFSLLGGAALFTLIHYSLRIAGTRASTPRGAALILLLVFNPMIWLMGNRYMPDASGAALALAAFWHLAKPEPRTGKGGATAGFFLAGLLTGWRLSYAPFLLAPALASLARREHRYRKLLAAGAGILVWLIPLLAVTGPARLIAAARLQTSGHFREFGGTIATEPGWMRRAGMLAEGVWADGLGGWLPGRHALTALVAAGLILFAVLGTFRALRGARDPGGSNRRTLALLAASTAVYAVWIFLFQNVVHQTRHVLPLITPLLLLLAAGLSFAMGPGVLRRAGWILAAFFLAAHAAVGTTLALQHRRPGALAQVKAYVERAAAPDLIVVCPPMVRDHLLLQGVRARLVEADSAADLSPGSLPAAARILTVGDYGDRVGRPLIETIAFHHNPHVNRLWPTIEIFRYGTAP